jgi:hypothetical protein
MGLTKVRLYQQQVSHRFPGLSLVRTPISMQFYVFGIQHMATQDTQIG